MQVFAKSDEHVKFLSSVVNMHIAYLSIRLLLRMIK